MEGDKTYFEIITNDTPKEDYEKTETVYGSNQESYNQPNKNETLKIPYETIKSSKNPKVQEVVKKLEDMTTLEQLTSYSEVHSEWEDSGVW